ncbi:MAG: hypothetical protein K1Y36_06310 [Blastocatellia bacterium]|nr:hypothetical protein [Blastocatellia bacterium]
MAQAEVHFRTLKGHRGEIRGIVFHPDETTLISCSYDQSIRFWEWETGQPKECLTGNHYVPALALSPDGTRFLASEWVTTDESRPLQTLGLFEFPSGKRLQTFTLETFHARQVVALPNTTTWVAATFDGMLWQWSEANDLPVWKHGLNPGGFTALAVSSDGTLGMAGITVGPLVVWDPQTGTELHRFTEPKKSVMAAGCTPDGSRIWAGVGGSKNVVVFGWDWKTRKKAFKKELKGHADQVWTMTFSPDGRFLATADNPLHDPGMYLWRVETGELLLHSTGIRLSSLAFSSDNRHLAGGSKYGDLYLWEIAPLTT